MEGFSAALPSRGNYGEHLPLFGAVMYG